MVEKINIISKGYTMEAFDWKDWLLSFQRPFIVLIVYLVGMISQYPKLAPIILIFGGSGMIVERLWSLYKFYVTEYFE